MEVSYTNLKNKEVINVFDGRKMGHIIDILFDSVSGGVKGFFVPGDKKIFRKSEDIFIPLTKIKKIGDDVVLVVLQNSKIPVYSEEGVYASSSSGVKRYENAMDCSYGYRGNPYQKSFVRYKRIDGKKYK